MYVSIPDKVTEVFAHCKRSLIATIILFILPIARLNVSPKGMTIRKFNIVALDSLTKKGFAVI